MKRFAFPKFKFEKKLMFSFVALVFVPVTIFGLLISVSIWKNKLEQYRERGELSFNEGIRSLSYLDHSIEHKVMFLSGIIDNMVLFNMDGSYTTAEYINEYSELARTMNALTADNVSLYPTVYVNNKYLTEGEYISKSNDIDPELYKKIESVDDYSSFWCLRTLKENGIDRRYVSIFSKIEVTEQRVIIIEVKYFLDYSVGLLSEACGDNEFVVYKYGDVTAIGDSNGFEYYTGDEALSHISSIENSKYFVTERSVVTGDSVSLFQKKDAIYSQCVIDIIWVELAFLAILLLIFLLLFYVSNKLSRRLNAITNRINVDINQLVDNVTVTEDTDKDDEFSLINNKIAELIKELREYYKKLSEYEIEILQSSVNPHLLYNTLASIRSISNSKKLNRIIDDMVQYYRIVLNNGEKYLTLKQELTLLDKYVELQKFAHEYKFDFLTDVPEELYQCKILKNLLQPLVENALFHGINSMDAGCYITITARRSGDAVVITVADNGEGMSEETLKAVREFKLNKVIGGYGIKNISKRLKALYGGDSGIEIDSHEGKGTVVTVSVPYDIDNKDEGN